MHKPLRIEISHKDAITYYHSITGSTRLKKVSTLYDNMGCGRICFNLPQKFIMWKHLIALKNSIELRDTKSVIFVCDKEVYPPVFRIGDC
jgi:hypothetical protein